MDLYREKILYIGKTLIDIKREFKTPEDMIEVLGLMTSCFVYASSSEDNHYAILEEIIRVAAKDLEETNHRAKEREKNSEWDNFGKDNCNVLKT